MFNYVIKKMVGTKNQRELRKMQPAVARINEREAWAKGLSDEQIREQVRAWQKEVADAPPKEKSAVLDRILPDSFALTRAASMRALGMRHFDVQLLGGMALHKGNIAEMKTGEGKTLVATLPCVLNALEGKGVHVVTVNDYLARRDAEWMGRLYRLMGLSVGCVVHGLSDKERQREYAAHITYGQNNEFGFDYLRDNMKFRLADYVQRELHYAIVDEVDSILSDEARTPLIISSPSEESTDKYYVINKVIPGLIRDRDFTVDEKARSVVLTDDGVEKVEAKLSVPNLYDPEQIETLHHVEQALRAHTLYRKDHEYVVKDGEVIIVDDFTGRLMPGRRWSDGLHQAVEAKENVKIENENQTLATVSFQNYFRLYTKLAGMTGTADTEAAEFAQIYKLEVLVIPTNRTNIRKDLQDTVYKTEREKFKADGGDGKFAPVTAGEVEQVYRAEYAQWKERHDAAVAKYKDHCAKEHDEVVGLGGLHILGTERHESRRIDNQLRGRSGRQGDPGSSKFYLSLEDDLMRIFASDRIAKLMDTFGVQENEPIEHPWLTKAIQGAQERVEGQNFDIRKNLLEYDDVMNQQRKTIYGMRKEVLASGAGVPLIWFTEDPKTKKKTRQEKMVTWKDQEEHLYDLIEDLIIEIVDEAVPRGKNDDFDTKALQQRVREQFNVDMSFEGATHDHEKLQLDIFNVVEKKLKSKFDALGDDFRLYTQWLYLNTIDQLWKDHLLQMDHLRQGIHLRGYGQKDPKIEYKKEGFELFQIMKGRIAASTIGMVMRVEPVQQVAAQAATQQPAAGRASGTLPPLPQRRQQQMIETHGEAPTASGGAGGTQVQNQTAPIVRTGPRVGRNDPCPCGSGKKYKKCHLPLEEGAGASAD